MSTYSPDCEKPENYTPGEALLTTSNTAKDMITVVNQLVARLEDLTRAIEADYGQVRNQLARKTGVYLRDGRKNFDQVYQQFALHLANEIADSSTYLAAVMSDMGVPVNTPPPTGLPPPAPQPTAVEAIYWTPLEEPQGTAYPAPPNQGSPNATTNVPSAAQVAPNALPANLPSGAIPLVSVSSAAQGSTPAVAANPGLQLVPGQNVINITGAPGMQPIQLVINLTVMPAPVYLLPATSEQATPDLLEGLSSGRGAGGEGIAIPVSRLSETGETVVGDITPIIAGVDEQPAATNLVSIENDEITFLQPEI